MKLSRLYSNKPEIFEPIDFIAGLNVVLAEIRLPENKKKDTHNLGKTTLGRLIDFCLLSGKDKHFFLFKHEEYFEEFIFFIEIELLDGTFITVRRSVANATKTSFKKHKDRKQDFSELPETSWDHLDMPFEKAKDLLDGILDLRSIKPWPYRKGLAYLLRSQKDYIDVFQLDKFKSSHKDWKPYLAHILGFNAEIIKEHYSKYEELLKKLEVEKIIKNELGESADNLSEIEGILSIKQSETEIKQKSLDAFDFRGNDKEKTKQLVDEIDAEIADLNSKRYYLMHNKKKIDSSLDEERILFNPEEASKLFEEAGVFFEGQIKRDFEQLIKFNRAITEERRSYLLEERAEIDAQLKDVNSQLNDYGNKRSGTLSFLSETDTFLKYKHLTNELVILKADIESLEDKRKKLHRLQELRKEIRMLDSEKKQLQTLIEEDAAKLNSDKGALFDKIRILFNKIIEEIVDQKAVLSVEPNREGHLDFRSEFLDREGNTTSADMGHTYKKLLCIAFDMAILNAHASDRFPHFVFHDGVFESLDDRKKKNLIRVIRQYSDNGIQHIITLIDSDLPQQISSEETLFEDSEIVLKLHDENDSGRLFKMPPW
ncbi:MAG: DUF2326 domain-containing protein [Nitrospirae bacterium]|nr:DUF2326 domain-containing protein [Nitrospirota bacterium]